MAGPVGTLPRVGFPFGGAAGASTFPFAAAQGIGPGVLAGFGGFGWSGWAIAFIVLFIIAIVFWKVWGTIGPVLGAVGGPGLFW